MNSPQPAVDEGPSHGEEGAHKVAIVGRGMMARAFTALRPTRDIVIFASGVSNSLETNPEDFSRERDLIGRTRAEHPDALMVYFSTCSIYDRDRVDTPYVRHKLEIESFLSGLPGKYLILRLPLVIGKTDHASTLPHALYARIKSGETFEVWKRATRYPIDVEDVVRITDHLLAGVPCDRQVISVALRAYPVMDFVHILEDIVGRRAKVKLVDKGASYDMHCPEVEKLTQELGLGRGEDYLDRVLRKYFPY